jgi:DNA polymerase-3 subunit epsilon
MSRGYRQVGLTLDGEQIILQKFHGKFSLPGYASESWLKENAALIKTGVGLDLETTGLDHATDQIIELAIRPFRYRSDTGEIVAIEEGYNGLQDPGAPLSETVKKVTGLTDDDLRGKSLDLVRIERILQQADVVIAHNARFDRPFVDRLLPLSKTKLWACSWRQVGWEEKGYPVHRLEILSLYHGFFVDAHRAMNDVNAMLNLLNSPDDQTGRPYLKDLLDECIRPQVLVYANGSPFETKDILRNKGYRWNADRKSWFRTVYENDLAAEIDWLEKTVYAGHFRGTTLAIPCIENFTLKD